MSETVPTAFTVTGILNSPGVPVAVIAEVVSRVRAQPVPPKVRPARRAMTDSGSMLKPAGMPSVPAAGNRTPTLVAPVVVGASVTVSAPVRVSSYDQLPAMKVRLTAPVVAKRPVSQ